MTETALKITDSRPSLDLEEVNQTFGTQLTNNQPVRRRLVKQTSRLKYLSNLRMGPERMHFWLSIFDLDVVFVKILAPKPFLSHADQVIKFHSF